MPWIEIGKTTMSTTIWLWFDIYIRCTVIILLNAYAEQQYVESASYMILCLRLGIRHSKSSIWCMQWIIALSICNVYKFLFTIWYIYIYTQCTANVLFDACNESSICKSVMLMISWFRFGIYIYIYCTATYKVLKWSGLYVYDLTHIHKMHRYI